MKKGFDLMKKRKSSNLILFDSFEKEIGIKICGAFKQFANFTQLGIDNFFTANFDLNKFYEESSGLILPMGGLKRSIDDELISEIVIDRFVENKKIISFWKQGYKSDQLCIDFKVLPIGYLYQPVHTRIFLGTANNKLGNIFIDLNEELRFKDSRSLIKVSNNIWEFINGLEETIPYTFFEKHSKQKIYKNWDENFWRIRKDKT